MTDGGTAAGTAAEAEPIIPLPAVVSSDELSLYWIVDSESRETSTDTVYHAIGPVYAGGDPDRMELIRYISNLTDNFEKFTEYQKYFNDLPIMSVSRFMDHGIMLHFCLTGDSITMSDIHSAGKFPDFEGSDDLSNSYDKVQNASVNNALLDLESNILDMIEHGDPDFKVHVSKLLSSGVLENRYKESGLRGTKNYFIIFTGLCARAAAKGGLAAEISFPLADRYCDEIEKCTSVNTILALSDRMVADFALRVRRLYSAWLSPQTQKASDYVLNHLGERITLADIAAYAGYSPDYLAKCFRAETNMSLTEYIIDCRIEKSKQLLLDTDMSIHDISDRLGFSSNSYFSYVFKKYTDATPQEYRKSHGRKK